MNTNATLAASFLGNRVPSESKGECEGRHVLSPRVGPCPGRLLRNAPQNEAHWRASRPRAHPIQIVKQPSLFPLAADFPPELFDEQAAALSTRRPEANSAKAFLLSSILYPSSHKTEGVFDPEQPKGHYPTLG